MISTLLCQAVTQPPPNVIYVREAAGGMPEWGKILVTAAAGAVIGILSAPASELAKGFVLHFPKRRKIRAQLLDELIENLDKVEAATSKILESPKQAVGDRAHCIGRALVTVKKLRTDQFDHYFAAEKAIVYEIDPARDMAEFYRLLRDSIEDSETHPDLDFVVASFKMAILLAVRFLRRNGIQHTRQSTLYEELEQLIGSGTAWKTKDRT